MKLSQAQIGRPLYGGAAILGGLVWLVFWTFHTVAHGPRNPAPTEGTFLGYTALEHAERMMLIAPPLLAVALIGLLRYEWHGLRVLGRTGLGCTLAALAAMGLVSAGLGPWTLYALSVVGLCLGLVLLGVGTRRLIGWPSWSRLAPLIASIAIPLLVAARWPGSPLLRAGDVVGYALLEGIGVAFALCWIALGYGLGWGGPPSASIRRQRVTVPN